MCIVDDGVRIRPVMPDLWELTRTLEQTLTDHGIRFQVISTVDMQERITTIENAFK